MHVKTKFAHRMRPSIDPTNQQYIHESKTLCNEFRLTWSYILYVEFRKGWTIMLELAILFIINPPKTIQCKITVKRNGNAMRLRMS